MDKRGKFIVLEGGEGTGKSTHIERLKTYLPETFPDREFIFTQEPGGSTFANEIRSIMISEKAKDVSGRTMLSLIMTSRSDHVEKLVLPSLETGKIVICDRYLASSFAYQITAQESPELEDIFWAYSKLLPQPDHYLLFEVDLEVAQERVRNRDSRSHFHNRTLAFHERVREGYRAYFEKSGLSHTLIDSNQSIEEVWKGVQAAVQSGIN